MLRPAWEAFPDGEHGEGEGGAHGRAKRPQGQGDPNARRQVVEARGKRDASGNPFEQCPAPGELMRNQQRAEADGQLRHGVQAQPQAVRLRGAALRITAATPGTKPQPGHEHGKNDGDERRSDGELGHGKAQPYQLIKDAAEPGDEKKQEEPWHRWIRKLEDRV